MPNKRDPNKVPLGVYIDREVRDLVKEILAEKGITFTDFIYAHFLKLLDKKENELIKAIEKHDGRTKAGKKNKKSKKDA